LVFFGVADPIDSLDVTGGRGVGGGGVWVLVSFIAVIFGILMVLIGRQQISYFGVIWYHQLLQIQVVNKSSHRHVTQLLSGFAVLETNCQIQSPGQCKSASLTFQVQCNTAVGTGKGKYCDLHWLRHTRTIQIL
jgi:hypothetical protein